MQANSQPITTGQLSQVKPNQWRNLWLISQFELVRLFFTVRGIISVIAFGMIWYFILKHLILQAANYINIPGFKDFVGEAFGQVGLQNILEWPVAEFAVFWLVSLFLLPLFTLFVTSDQTSSDRSRGTLRFLTLRTSRDSIYFGRFLGQLIIQMLLLSAVMLATFAMSIWNDHSQWQLALYTGFIMAVNLFIVILPFTALMALCSAIARSSRLATMLAFIGVGAIIALTGYLTYKWPIFESLKYLIPGLQIGDLIQSNHWETLQHAWLPIIQAIVLLALGRTVIQRSSL